MRTLARTNDGRLQRGLSLVELMVGIAIGLFIVAAASLLLSRQLGENRRLLLETQLQQDLRASADIITRELRRAGYSGLAESSVWNPTIGTTTSNGYLELPVTTGATGSIEYNYKRPDNSPGPFKYWVDSGTIKTKLSATATPQDLTDKNVLFVDGLSFVLGTSTAVRLTCPKACPSPPPGMGDDYCWPTTAVRDLTVTITGHAVSDSAVQRSVTSRVRLRNDQVLFNAALPQACPA